MGSEWERACVRLRSGVRQAAAAVLLCALVGACGEDDDRPRRRPVDPGSVPGEQGEPDLGDIEVSWGQAPDAISKELGATLQQERLFEELASAFNQTLKFPRDLPVSHEACGEENAFYDPSTGELTMCYELLTAITEGAIDPEATADEIGEQIVGTWMFVFFHELGHALIDMYELPTTGREEDAVDDFSTLLLIQSGRADFALQAADYWRRLEMGPVTDLHYADEHSLNAQRAYAIMCLVFGSDPNTYAGLVTQGFLPESRAVGCPAEYQMKDRAWSKLLEPWEK